MEFFPEFLSDLEYACDGTKTKSIPFANYFKSFSDWFGTANGHVLEFPGLYEYVTENWNLKCYGKVSYETFQLAKIKYEIVSTSSETTDNISTSETCRVASYRFSKTLSKNMNFFFLPFF